MYVRNMGNDRIAPVQTTTVENAVYAGGDVSSDENKPEVQAQQKDVAMQENDVYEGDAVTAEYDVYTGSQATNHNAQNHEFDKEEGHDLYDYYAGSTATCREMGTTQKETQDEEVVMTENDVYTRH